MDGNRGPGEAGPSGFVNHEPLTREQRMAGRDKDLLEKTRLQARRRGPLDAPENVVGNPTVPPKNAPAYCGEADRFNRDVAGVNNSLKKNAVQKKEEVYAFKRATNYQREHNIWANDMAAEQRKESKYDTARAAGTGQRRNQGGEAFNIITLGSNTNSGGQAFAAKESAYQDRRQERAANLYVKSHSVTHNIITGEPIKMPSPAKPYH